MIEVGTPLPTSKLTQNNHPMNHRLRREKKVMSLKGKMGKFLWSPKGKEGLSTTQEKN